ncbi:unnamed protein product, partial [marine sediment metagenome]
PFTNVNYTFQETVETISRIGYESIELVFTTLERGTYIHPETLFGKNGKRILETCSSFGVEISALGAYAGHLSRDEMQRRQTIDFVKRSLELAARLGIANVVTVSGEAKMEKEKAWKILFDIMEEEARYAEEVGVKIALHPHIGNLVLSPDDSVRLIETVRSDSFGLTLDAAHLFVSGFDLIDSTKKLGKYVTHAHLMGVQDRIMGDQHPIGIEESDLPNLEWLKALRNEGYCGAIAVRVPDSTDGTILEKRTKSSYNYLC